MSVGGAGVGAVSVGLGRFWKKSYMDLPLPRTYTDGFLWWERVGAFAGLSWTLMLAPAPAQSHPARRRLAVVWLGSPGVVCIMRGYVNIYICIESLHMQQVQLTPVYN